MPTEQFTDQRKIRLVCTAAQMVLENGGETYRVEETALRMAAGLGLTDISVVAFPTSIFLTADGSSIVRRITSRGTNLSRLSRINDVSRRVERHALDVQEAEVALKAISDDRGWNHLVMVIAYGIASGSFCLLFNGGFGAFVVALLIGLLVQAIQPLFSRLSMGNLFFNFSGGFLTAVLAQVMSVVVPYHDVNAAIIGAIMPLLTGLLMTTAVRDTIYGDLVSGIARAVEALLLAACVALGVFIGLKMTAMIGGISL